jgi:hypothetical protein
MDSDHPLSLNLRKVVRCLNGILSAPEKDRIIRELHRNVRQALRLAEAHLRSARSISSRMPGAWRQRVSRGYYCCYCASRAIRLARTGTFSAEVQDHQKVGELPDTFPDRAIWADILTKFRADRNLADYDHTVLATALEYSADEYVEHARAFLEEAKTYLRREGVL